ncbi:MAG TPA: hypothetical protein VL486_11350 [Verrucomicrobiae bacterium]|nr:hypothetical protein [Verrucomicrobiae bacterium]
MKRIVCICAMLALASIGVSSSVYAQTNSWDSTYRGYWDDGDSWSLRVAPTNSQSVYITNDISTTVTIDSYTSGTRPDTMTVSNLNLWAPVGVTNTLELADAGTNVPLQILDTLTVSAGGVLDLTYSALSMRNVTNVFTNGVLSVDGVMVLHNNGLVMADSGLFVGVDSNASGSCLVAGGQLFLTNTATSAIGVNGSGQMIVSNGQVQAQSGFVILGSGTGSQGALNIAGGNYMSGYLGRFAVGMGTGAVGTVSVTNGNLVMTNAFVTLLGGYGSGQLNLSTGNNCLGSIVVGGNSGGRGAFTVAGGVNNVQGAIFVGNSPDATGTVWVTGGQLIMTNWPAYIGGHGQLPTTNLPGSVSHPAVGQWTVSNGTMRARSLNLAVENASDGRLTAVGGTVLVSSNVVVGNCGSDIFASFNIDGAAVYVTNAAHNAFVDVRSGTMTLNSGLLVIDKLIVNSPCGHFQHVGGTLQVNALVLNPVFSATGDGLPNAWKQAYGLDPLSSLGNNGPDGDPDGDGRSNLQEYQDGTDPTNAASALRILSTTPEGNDIRVTWTTVGGKTYILQGTSNGSTNHYVDLATMYVDGTGESTSSYLDVGGAMNSPPRLYRVQVQVPSCALSVVGWGDNNYGKATPPPGLTNAVTVSAGSDFSLALKSDGTVVGWGSGNYGQTNPPRGFCAIAIAAGYDHGLALASNGKVIGWGRNTYNQATPPAGLADVVAIGAGQYYSLALRRDGTVVAWGNYDGGPTNVPPGLTNAVAISAGYLHALAVRSDGTVVAWGNNDDGQTNVPPGLTDVMAISAGYYHSLALRSDGTVVGWGDYNSGQTNVPPGLVDAVAVAAGASHSLAVRGDGTVAGWGDNSSGQATPPIGLAGVVAIAAGNFYSLAVATDVALLPPSNLTATAVSPSRVDLNWTDFSSTEDRFGIERASSSTGPWTEIGSVSSNATTYSDTGVASCQTFYYRVRAYSDCARSLYSPVASAATISATDSDCDGIPDAWMMQYFHHPTGSEGDHSRAGDDADGDGFTNLQEYQAGTDPTDSASVFHIIEIVPDGDDVLITWTAVGGKRYVLQTTTGSSGGFTNDFVDLNPAFIAHGTGETTITVLHLGAAAGSPARFYRVRLMP